MTRDTIERELVLRAPIERVWTAITDSAQVSKWFGSEGTIDPRPGGVASFGWPGFGTFHARVDEVDPPRRFAYHWCLDKDTPVDVGPTTRVEFTLEEVAEGTRLRLVESGFASLPEGVRDRHLIENTEGWKEELAELAGYVGAPAA
jgi:uncharacterized protein YndB with AHSA1/START domain